MNVKKRMFIIMLLVFFLLGILVSAAVAGGDEGQGTKLKRVTVALPIAPPTLDPWDHRSPPASLVQRNLTDALGVFTDTGGLILNVAESMTQIDDVTWEFKLREDITFHNGEPMTADDVVFSVSRAEEYQWSHMLGTTYKSIEKIDDYTVHVNNEPGLFRHAVFADYLIYPKKYFEKVGSEEFAKHPIGIGPFRLIESDLPSRVVLERYENYWGGPPKLKGEVNRIPALDQVIFLSIPEATTRVAALLAGDVDIIMDVPADSVPLLDRNPETKVLGGPGTNIRHLNFNVNKAPLDDKRVRQAIAYAINIDLIVEQLLGGFADPIYGRPYNKPDGLPSFPENAVDHLLYEYNPEKSKALLEEAGVGKISLVIDTIPDLVAEAQAISQMLGDIGIDASVRTWERAVILEEFKKGQRDIYFGNRGQSGRSPEGFRNSIGTGMKWNYSGYSNPTWDALIEEALARKEHDEERKALFMQAYEIGLDDLPAYWMYIPDALYATRVNVKNFQAYDKYGNIPFHRVDIE